MLVFLDTEFTDFIDPHLISLGMAAEYGEDFYAEVPYPDHACSTFVREAVVPLLGQIPHSFFTANNLRTEIIKWLEIVRRDKEDIFICIDYQTDWDLFCRALDYRVPPWCHCKMINGDINELLLYHFYLMCAIISIHILYVRKLMSRDISKSQEKESCFTVVAGCAQLRIQPLLRNWPLRARSLSRFTKL